jgi:hypothetical protein
MLSMTYHLGRCGESRAFSMCMSFWLIFLTAQVIVMLFAVVRESGKDKRFEGEKLGFRS